MTVVIKQRILAAAATVLTLAALAAPRAGLCYGSAGAAKSVRDKMVQTLDGLKGGDYTSVVDAYDVKSQDKYHYYIHTQYLKPSSVKMTISEIAMDDKDASTLLVTGSDVYEYSPRDGAYAHGTFDGTTISLPNGLSGAKWALKTVNSLIGAKPFLNALTEDEGGLPLTIKRTGLDVLGTSLLTCHTQDAVGVEHNEKFWVNVQDTTPRRIVVTDVYGDSETEVYREDFLTFKKNPVFAEDAFKWTAPETASEITPPATGDPIAPGQFGVKAPEFTLPDRSGDPVSFSEYRGRVVLLLFWNSSSPESVAELPRLQKLFNAFSAKGLAVLAVNTMEDGTIRERFLAKNNFTFEIIIDDQLYSKKLFGVTKLPTLFLVGRDGTVAASHIGFDAVKGEAMLRGELAALKIR